MSKSKKPFRKFDVKTHPEIYALVERDLGILGYLPPDNFLIMRMKKSADTTLLEMGTPTQPTEAGVSIICRDGINRRYLVKGRTYIRPEGDIIYGDLRDPITVTIYREMVDENNAELRVGVVENGENVREKSLRYTLPWHAAPEARKEGLLAVLSSFSELDDRKYAKHVVGLPEKPESMDIQIYLMRHRIV